MEEDLQTQVVVVAVIGKMCLTSPGSVPPIFSELIKNQKVEDNDFQSEGQNNLVSISLLG